MKHSSPMSHTQREGRRLAPNPLEALRCCKPILVCAMITTNILHLFGFDGLARDLLVRGSPSKWNSRMSCFLDTNGHFVAE